MDFSKINRFWDRIPIFEMIVTLIAGSFTMAIEMAASRSLAPYLGSSLIVWSGLIGMILAAASVGAYVGGVVSERLTNIKDIDLKLDSYLFTAGFYLAIVAIVKGVFLSPLVNMASLRLAVIIASVALFALPAAILASITPLLIRRRIVFISKNIEKTDHKIASLVGILSSLSALGAIIGTIIPGFWLLPLLGTNRLLLSISCILMILASSIYARYFPKKSLFKFAIALCFISPIFQGVEEFKVEKDVDSAYQRILIGIGEDQDKNKTRSLQVGSPRAAQSIINMNDTDRLASSYLRLFRLAEYLSEEPQKPSLLIGGGAFLYARDYLKRQKGMLHVAEIDGELESLAEKYFFWKRGENVRIWPED